MKKLAYVFAALGAIAVAIPSIASAETVVIKRGGDHHRHWGGGPRAEMRGPGWHHRHRDRVVIVKRHHHRY
jgi:hypothetical protein